MPHVTPLQPGRYYHIYNRGNNREDLFVRPDNYRYFLKLYALHTGPVVHTFAYCLMRNHFHLVVRVKEDAGLRISKAFSNLFNAYARAFNFAQRRIGALFQRPFHRIEVDSDAYFSRLITYIHQNPQKHGFVKDFRDWPYSSFHALVSSRPTRLQRDSVLDWFGGARRFVEAHEAEVRSDDICALVAEDFE